MALDKSNIKETKGFTFVSKAIYQDTELSLKAKGLLSILFALPDGYDITVAGLCSFSTDKTSSVSDGLKELEKHCYLIRKQQNKGKFASEDYIPFPAPYNEEQKDEIFRELSAGTSASNIRIEADDYTHISNYHLYDKNLSFEAKGLLSYLFSYPSFWNFNIRYIADKNGNGVDSVGNIVLELRVNGYLSIDQDKDSDTGLFGRSIYTFYKTPRKEVAQKFFDNEYPKLSAEKQKRVQTFLKKAKSPICENPYTDFPYTVIPNTASQRTDSLCTENEGQTNNINNNNINSNNISSNNIKSSSKTKQKNKTAASDAARSEMKKKIDDKICELRNDKDIDQVLLETLAETMLDVYMSKADEYKRGKHTYNRLALITTFNLLNSSQIKTLLMITADNNPTVPSCYFLTLLTNGYEFTPVSEPETIIIKNDDPLAKAKVMLAELHQQGYILS